MKGEDEISADILKAGGPIITKMIHKIIIDVWNEEKLPDEWNESIITPLHKKGDRQNCANYRGISLLNHTYKVLSKIIQNRLEVCTNSIIGEHQSDFIKGRSTTEQIFILKETVARYWEFSKKCYILFIDFTKAYDSLSRPKIWQQMEKFGLPKKLINLSRITVEKSKCKISQWRVILFL